MSESYLDKEQKVNKTVGFTNPRISVTGLNTSGHNTRGHKTTESNYQSVKVPDGQNIS